MSKLRPTVEEFVSAVQSAFTYLTSEYGFVQEMNTRDQPRVAFASDRTRVVVEGTDWGLNTRVAIGSSGSRDGFENYDLSDLVSLRPALSDSEPVRGSVSTGSQQLAQVVSYSRILRVVGEDVLHGDHAIFEQLRVIVESRRRAFDLADK